MGTGAAIGANEVLTAQHVIRDGGTIVVYQGKYQSRAQVIGANGDLDVALLQTQKPVPQFTSVRTEQFDPNTTTLMAFGNTTGTQQCKITEVSGNKLWFSSVPRNGDSGGPIMLDGKVVSVISAGNGRYGTVGASRYAILDFLKRCRRPRPSRPPARPTIPPHTHPELKGEDGADGQDGKDATFPDVTYDQVPHGQPLIVRLNEDRSRLHFQIPAGKPGEDGDAGSIDTSRIEKLEKLVEQLASENKKLRDDIARIQDSRIGFNQYTDDWQKYLGGKALRIGDLTTSDLPANDMPAASAFSFTFDIPEKIRQAIEAANRN